jgi:hypothetical protein
MTRLAAERPGSAPPVALTAAPRDSGGLRELSTDDLQRIAVAIDAEVAKPTRTTYASA